MTASDKRTSININSANGSEFQFIDHMRGATQFGGPATGGTWNTVGGAVWGQNIDSDGWPAYSTATINKRAPFGGIFLPSSTDFAGPYTIDGFGSGTIQFDRGSWTIGAATGVSLAGTTLTVTDQGAGVRWTAQLTYSGSAQTIGVNALTVDPLNTGKFITNVRFFRTSELSQLQAGNIFRAAWKQTYVDFCPSVVRFMNWFGDNDALMCRFESRTLPSHAAWAGLTNWVAGPKYGETTGINQYSLAAVTGTPASMQHGELATCRIGNTAVRQGTFTGGGVDRTITNITNANPGVVTSVAHGFNTGDVIIHKVTGGMANLHMLPCTITVSDADTYSLGVDTTSFGSFNGPTPTGNTTNNGQTITNLSSTTGIAVGMSVTGTNIPANTLVTQIVNATQVQINKSMTGTGSGITFTFKVGVTGNQYISLQVGSGNDRTSYPVLFTNGIDYASHFGNDYIVAGDYKTFYFDKTIAAKTDGAGALVYGVWFFNSNGADRGHKGGVPLEICTALVNELNAMSPVAPIDMWITIPHWALLSSDPDYSAASNLATKSIDVIMNGANGYSGLTSAAKLWIEYSNETWNTGSAFTQASYLARRGQCRSGAAWAATTVSDYTSMVGLRSYLMMKEIQAAFSGSSRLKYVLAGQGTLGIGSSTMNYARIHGSTAMLTDTLNPTNAEPMSVHDVFAWAAYLYNDDSNATYSLATCTTAWLAAGTDPVAKEAAYALYVQGIKTFGGNETIDRYFETLLPAYAAHLVSIGKETCMYEGGWDRAISGSADNQNFLLACKASKSWAVALRNAHDVFNSTTGAILPADYIQTGVVSVGDRWGHGLNALDGHNLDQAWQLLALRNRSKSRLYVKN